MTACVSRRRSWPRSRSFEVTSCPRRLPLQLESRTQGWAAGIVLMLEHAKLSGHLAEFPDDAAPRAIFDYLAEIFARFERETQQFLLRIACLPRMSAAVAEVCRAIPRRGGCSSISPSNDYFVSEVAAEEGRVYQLHPLLRLPRNRAAQDLPEALASAHLRRAASLLSPPAGQVEDAYRCLRNATTGRRSPASPRALRTDDARAGAKRDTRRVAGAAPPRCSAAMPTCWPGSPPPRESLGSQPARGAPAVRAGVRSVSAFR